MMLDGTYTGYFVSTVTGTADAKIYIKPQNYMAAVIDGSLQIDGEYTRLRNIRCTNSDINRGTSETPQGTISRPPNIYPTAPNVEIINVMYDNGGGGVLAYNDANGLVLYGDIGFNNGWADDTLGGAQNLYIHSLNKTVKHCIFGGAFKKSVAVYTTNGTIENITLEENVVFARGTFLVGGNHGVTDGPIVNGNHILCNLFEGGYVYDPNGALTFTNNHVYALGRSYYIKYFTDLILTGNKFVAVGSEEVWTPFAIAYPGADINNVNSYVLEDNEYHYTGAVQPFNDGSFAQWQALGYDLDSSYSTDLPSVNEIFVYPNEYPDADDKRMGIIVIWNWAGDNTVAVDLTDLGLEVGTTYRWRQAQDPLVDIDTWVCAGNSFTFTMTGHTVAKPIGFDEELIPTQFPTFGCFIIEKVV